MNDEVGPYVDRPSRILFEEWVHLAHSTGLKGDQNADCDDDLEVLPLELIQPDDPSQIKSAYSLLSKLPEAIEYYLTQLVFPDVMQHQSTKLQASGYDIGSDMLFGVRLGFSGTPTDLVPRQLRCVFEQGDDSKMIRVLTSPLTVSYEVLSSWSVELLLDHIANSKFSALIDTGALITGSLCVSFFFESH
jgi:hypothetical protein